MEITIQPGQILQNRYQLDHPLGFGAFGSVWKSHHLTLEQYRAVKAIPLHDLDPLTLERVKIECVIGGKLEHGNGVVQVYDAFEEQGHLFIVMELMEGGSLEKVLRKNPPEWAVALAWSFELCQALDQVHIAGIIHRDIKPQNILLSKDGHLKLSDFGVAHLPQASITRYQPGTPGYRAPELEAVGLAGAAPSITAAADVYSLCAVLFELWGGRAYAPYKAQPIHLVRAELDYGIAGRFAAMPETSRQKITQAILAGLENDPNLRPNLAELQKRLREAQQTVQASQKALNQAQDAFAKSALSRRQTPTLVSPLVQAPYAGPSLPKEQTALVGWLADDFGRWFLEHPDREVILWFDPQREWEPILPLLAPHLNLIRDDDSPLYLRYQLEQRQSGQPVVVYSPSTQAEADYLAPFAFIGRVFDQSLYDFLLTHDCPLPRSGDERKAMNALLPLAAAASEGKGEAFWQHIKTLADVEAALLPNFRERLFEFLAAPAAAWQSLDQEGLLDVFTSLVARRYGYTGAETATGYAQRLLMHWMCAELAARAGQPADFPFRTSLPHALLFQACIDDLKAFRYDSRYQETYVSQARQIERSYPALLSWAAQKPVLLTDPLLPTLARQEWTQTWQVVQAWTTREQVLKDLYTLQQETGIAAKGYWTNLEETPEWRILQLAVKVILGAEDAVQAAGRLNTPDEFIQAYQKSWWQIDQMYRHYHTTIQAGTDLPDLTRWVIHFYTNYLDQTNLSWTNALKAAASWPVSAEIPPAATASQAMWLGQGRQAIFVIDALRYELAMELKSSLRFQNVELSAWLSELPSITPLGMSALMPKSQERKVSWERDWQISQPDFAGNLAEKDGRIAWLQSCLPGARTLPLRQWLQPGEQAPQQDHTLVVFADDLDALGENVSELSITAFSNLLQPLSQGVRKAVDAGYSGVHVVTDHGFLLLGQVADYGKIEPDNTLALKAAHRYLVGRNLAEKEGLLRYAIQGSQVLAAWYPSGISCFKVGGSYNYAHGGPTLQETLIPYLYVKQDTTRVPIRVRLNVAERIFSGIFKVTLEPVAKGLFVKEREVKLSLQRASGEQIRSWDEIVSPNDPVTKNLSLLPTDQIKQGDLINLVIQDLRSGEELDRKTILVQVNLEL